MATATQEGQDVRQGQEAQRKAMNLDRIFETLRTNSRNSNEASKMEYLRTASKNYAQALVDIVPPGADLSAAIRHVREAWYTAEAGIVLDGQL